MFAQTESYIAGLMQTTGGGDFTKRPTVLYLVVPDAMRLRHVL